MSDDVLKPYSIHTVESVFRDHHIFFNEFTDNMPELFSLIVETMGGTDCLHFHMNNCGGDMHSGLQLLTLVQEAMARGTEVVLHIESDNDSMAAVFISKLIILGVETRFGEHFTIMFHSPSGGVGTAQRTVDIEDDMRHLNKSYFRLLQLSCAGILTEEEMKAVAAGLELRIPRDDFVKRCQSLIDVPSETVH